ncbi:GntR family transcriptional regulator [Microvirga yunnanensis]|nr:GntR family transcriptional regulator [Microvirga sp. HBU65207]
MPDIITDHIIELIAEGQLGGKNDLNEADLGAKLNVSCVPLRDSLRIL